MESIASQRLVQLDHLDRAYQMYEDMLLMRRFEERVIQLYQDKYIAGFCHTYIGQEAVLVGVTQVMEEGDPIMTGYRCHAHALASGLTPREVMAELAGKRSGVSGGKGGSMHLYNIPKKFYGGHGIVGAYTSIGTGIAFAQKYQNTGKVCFTFFGDGASNQGQVYECYNMASLWKLPIVYLIENNRYGIGTSADRACAGGDLYKRGEPFGIPGWKVDGMNVFEVIKAVEVAAKHARSGRGPTIVECDTYRYKGHSVSDPGNYRTKDEVDGMKLQDPILQLENHLKETGHFSEDRKSEIHSIVMKKVLDAAEFAKLEPEPDLAELFKDVYKDWCCTSSAESLK